MKESIDLHKAKEIMSNLNIIIYGTIRNIEEDFIQSFTNLDILASFFKKTHIIIFENDSKDKTRDVLNSWYQNNNKKNYYIIYIASRDIIDNKFNQLLAKYRNDGVHIKKPDHTYVFMIVPQSIEFFQGRSCKPAETPRIFSHSDKIRYTKNSNCSKWSIVRYWA